MIIFSSYSLLFHPHLPPLRNLKPIQPFSIQLEENVSFPLGNQLVLGEQTNGDIAHFERSSAGTFRVCIIAMSLKWLARCKAKRSMSPASSGVKRYPKNWMPKRNLKELDSIKKIKSNEQISIHLGLYTPVWYSWQPVFRFHSCPECIISVMNSISIHMRSSQVRMTKYRKVLCEMKWESFTKVQQFGHNDVLGNFFFPG